MVVGFEELTRAVAVKFKGKTGIVMRAEYSPIDQVINMLRQTPPKPDVYEGEGWVSIEKLSKLAEVAATKGQEGRDASVLLELGKIMNKYKAIKPVKLDLEKRKHAIKGRLIITEKTDASNEFVRNKSRFVARGDMRKNKPKEVLEIFSPTAAFASVLTVLNIILNKKLAWKLKDVESAYLNSEFGGGLYMKLDPNVARHVVTLDPSAAEFLTEDGSMYVEIVKALYGLQESAKLWYETLGKKFTKMGFDRSNYDHALFFKRVGDELVIILVYVDDMLIAGSPEQLAKIEEELNKEFSMTSTELSPPKYDYVGLRVEYSAQAHEFLLSQPGMISKITEGITVASDVPCDQNLYKETEETPLEDQSAKTDFRSKLMECQWAARVRPDIKVAIGYLSTKMQSPNVGDAAKLLKLRQYLYGTKDFKMKVKPVDVIQVYASADASFGPFKDGKSNTGMVVTVGVPNAPVIVKTQKQTSVANSSTAAELIAFSSTLEEVFWLVLLIEELGFKQETVEIEQDNTSTMRLIEKGPSSTGRTKWINIKQFWISEHLEKGDVKLKYVPSLELIADGLTKPLGRKAFKEWRRRILNI